jgi:hypothetical protein
MFSTNYVGGIMRRAFPIITVILFSTVLAFAQGPPPGMPSQGQDDHDTGPVQSGYAVVTPAEGAAGLVVFETFGEKKPSGDGATTQAGVLPPDLTTNAVLFVEASGRLSKNLGVAIVNPNNASVDVTLTLRKSDGTQSATTTVTVPKFHQVSNFVTELFASPADIPKDFAGTLSITSVTPVSVIGLRFRGSNFSTLPATSLSATPGPLPNIAPGVGGAGALLLPQFASRGGWSTEVVMVNTTGSDITVRLDLFKQDGSDLTATLNGQKSNSFKNIVIKAHCVVEMAPRDSHGDDDF